MDQQPHAQQANVMKVSERSLRRVQITMAALQAADQTAQAAAQAAQMMVLQARKSLDEALGAICDAHDQILPADYTVSLNQAESTVTITSDVPALPAGAPNTVDLEGSAQGHRNGHGLLSAVPAAEETT